MATDITLNASHSNSYMCENNAIYILSTFNLRNMGELIGHLGNTVHSFKPMPQWDTSTVIKSPYDISNIKNPIIDVFIDSCGGEEHVLSNIMALLNIAKHRGAIIRTTVLSCAYSCGSMLAIQGTPGFRIMSHTGEHLIHYGTAYANIESEEDITRKIKRIAINKEKLQSTYLAHTNMSNKQLKSYMNNEYGFLGAPKCLEMGLCDWIIGENGILIGRTR